MGNTLTEADIRLFVTLLRFDPVYVGHFKCNIKRIKDYQYISKYMQTVQSAYDIEDTIHMDHIKTHLQSFNVKSITIYPKGQSINRYKKLTAYCLKMYHRCKYFPT